MADGVGRVFGRNLEHPEAELGNPVTIVEVQIGDLRFGV
jgi:hypothetical protein